MNLGNQIGWVGVDVPRISGEVSAPEVFPLCVAKSGGTTQEPEVFLHQAHVAAPLNLVGITMLSTAVCQVQGD